MKSLNSVPLWRPVCIALFISLALGGCMDILHSDHPTTTYLVSSTKVGNDISFSQLQTIVSQTNPAYAGLLKYGITAYKLVYKTKNWDGTTINASGLLILPTTPKPVPMIGQQHGTIFTDAEAPSYFGPASEAYQFSSIFASNGYILACPDYIGFGESNKLIHPYEYRPTQAQTCLDMLRAAREYLQANPASNWDSRLYLAGYSEGGYATMALYKKMQDEVPTEFNLKAVSTGAGAYDKTNFTKAVVGLPSAGNPNWNRAFLWVLLTYNTIYSDLRRPLDYYFVEPYLTDVKTNGLAATLNVSIDQTFTTTFRNGVVQGTDKAFLAALADNDIYNWKPLIPLLLTQGDADQQVYPLNTASAYAAMTAQGSQVVIPNIVAGKTHVETIPYWLDATYALFQKFQ